MNKRNWLVYAGVILIRLPVTIVFAALSAIVDTLAKEPVVEGFFFRYVDRFLPDPDNV